MGEAIIARLLSSVAAGVAGNALFWLINAQVDLLSGPGKYGAMIAVFAICFGVAFTVLQDKAQARKRVASNLESGGALHIDASGTRVTGDQDATVASDNRSHGDMTVTAKNIDIT